MRDAGKRRRKRGPTQPDKAWVESGGERIWAVGFTEGGTPYGLTEEELETARQSAAARAGWVRAKRTLETVMRGWAGGGEVEVGRVSKLGEGLFRESFAAEVDVGRGRFLEVAALLPKRSADPELGERVRIEARLLHELADVDLPFRVPTAYGVFPEGRHAILVRSFEAGIPLDLRAGRQPVEPWTIVGGIAAAIHRLPLERLPSLPARHRDRREHARTALEPFHPGRVPAPEAAAARAWIEAHLPPPEPCVPLHGDLLGQNILLGIDAPNAVIDWERAQLGDPAYDLAIVTRGARKPFQTAGGLARLLDAYARAGAANVEPAHVQIHELALHARWFHDARVEKGEAAAENQLRTLRNLLRRAGA